MALAARSSSRTLYAALLLLALIPARAAFGETAPSATRRYLVATREPFAADRFRAIQPDGGAAARNVTAFRAFDGFAADLDPTSVAALRASSGVRWLEPVVERHALDLERRKTHAARTPYATRSAQTIPQGVSAVGAPGAWKARLSGEVNVVVVDTGIDFLHPDLAPFWRGGESLIYPGDEPLDDAGHGTHVAGTIAAAHNQFGVAGVAGAANLHLWGLKILDADGKWGTSEALIKAIDWIMQRRNTLGGRWVVNMSLGGPLSSQAEREAFQRATDAGIIFVAASGNENTPELAATVNYPAAYPEVIAVGAIDQTGSVPSFSNGGPELDLAAPGVDVLSTVRRGRGYRQQVYGPSSVHAAQALGGSSRGSITGEVVFCGLGKPEEIPTAVRGRIALVRRGEIRFNEKTRNAVEAGAMGVAIINNDDSSMLNWSLMPEDDPEAKNYDWPVTLGLSLDEGDALLASLPGEATMVWDPDDDYDDSTGTSMSAPHVAGAVALLWAIAPAAPAQTIITSLLSTAHDIGPAGSDPRSGSGVVDVDAAAHQLAPEAFIPSTEPARPTTGRRILRRGRG